LIVPVCNGFDELEVSSILNIFTRAKAHVTIANCGPINGKEFLTSISGMFVMVP